MNYSIIYQKLKNNLLILKLRLGILKCKIERVYLKIKLFKNMIERMITICKIIYINEKIEKRIRSLKKKQRELWEGIYRWN